MVALVLVGGLQNSGDEDGAPTGSTPSAHQYRRLIAELNKRCPYEVDAVTRVDSYEYYMGEIVINQTVMGMSDAEIEKLHWQYEADVRLRLKQQSAFVNALIDNKLNAFFKIHNDKGEMQYSFLILYQQLRRAQPGSYQPYQPHPNRQFKWHDDHRRQQIERTGDGVGEEVGEGPAE